jgi:hypothetical protein
MLQRTNTLRKLENLKPATVTWAEQLDGLRQMWTDGVPTDEIATALGRTNSSVLTQAVRIGLPRRASSGRKATTVAVTDKKVSPRLVSQQNVISFPVRGYSGAAIQSMPAPKSQSRKCLMCSSSFPSHGSHNRICGRCKETKSYQAGHDCEYSLKTA